MGDGRRETEDEGRVRAVTEIPFSFLTTEGLTIRGDVHAPGNAPAPVVLCVHGFKGFKDWGFWPHTARGLAAAGFAVIRFNFSHSGLGRDLESFSEMELFETGTYTREVEDLREILSRLTREDLPGAGELAGSRVGLLAHSRGAVSALAVAAAREFPVASVALWNPVSSVLWWDAETRERWRQSGSWEVVNSRTGQVFHVRTALLEDAETNSEALDPVANAGRLEMPLLCVVAASDESVPPASGRRLAVAAGAKCSLHEIPETGHTFGAAHPFGTPTRALEDALRVTREHFERTLGRAAA